MRTSLRDAKRKNPPNGGFCFDLAGGLGLSDEAGLDGLNRHPLALDRAVRLENADALDVRTENALGLLHELEADAATLLGLTAVNDSAALDGALAGDAADTGHSSSSSFGKSEQRGGEAIGKR